MTVPPARGPAHARGSPVGHDRDFVRPQEHAGRCCGCTQALLARACTLAPLHAYSASVPSGAIALRLLQSHAENLERRH